MPKTQHFKIIKSYELFNMLVIINKLAGGKFTLQTYLFELFKTIVKTMIFKNHGFWVVAF